MSVVSQQHLFSSSAMMSIDGGGSVQFDNSTDNLQISNASALSGFSGNFTIEFWFKGGNQTSFAVFLETYNSSGGQKWAIQADSGGDNNMIWVRNGSITLTTSGIDALDNAWHHHAVVRSGSTITYYIDGVSRGSESYSGTLSACTNLIIGDYSQSIGGYGIVGYLSNVRIVNSAVYTSNFTPSTSPLTAVTNTKLLCCQSKTSATAADVTPGTIVNNGTTASSSNPF